jgi:hypothetical protein
VFRACWYRVAGAGRRAIRGMSCLLVRAARRYRWCGGAIAARASSASSARLQASALISFLITASGRWAPKLMQAQAPAWRGHGDNCSVVAECTSALTVNFVKVSVVGYCHPARERLVRATPGQSDGIR